MTWVVLGRTRWSNLWVCGGYWRNGILLAPTAARLLADAMDASLSDKDALLLDACRWDRFFAPVSRNRRGCARATRGSPRARRRIWIGSATSHQDRRAGGAAANARARGEPRRVVRQGARARADLGRGRLRGRARRRRRGVAQEQPRAPVWGEGARFTRRGRYSNAAGGTRGLPRAAPDEDDVILSMREVLGDGTYGPEFVEGALPPIYQADDESGRHPRARRVAGAEGAAPVRPRQRRTTRVARLEARNTAQLS